MKRLMLSLVVLLFVALIANAQGPTGTGIGTLTVTPTGTGLTINDAAFELADLRAGKDYHVYLNTAAGAWQYVDIMQALDAPTDVDGLVFEVAADPYSVIDFNFIVLPTKIYSDGGIGSISISYPKAWAYVDPTLAQQKSLPNFQVDIGVDGAIYVGPEMIISIPKDVTPGATYTGLIILQGAIVN